MITSSVKPAIECDYDAQISICNFQRPTEAVTLWHKWSRHFSNASEVAVCLSGGIDSQFVMWTLQQLGVKVHPKTYALMWEDNVTNANDVLMSMRFSERMGTTCEIINVDYEDFLFSGEHFSLGKLYRCNSPQLTVHLKFLELLGNSLPVAMGSEAPRLFYDPVDKFSLAGQFHPAAYLQPFNTFAEKNQMWLTRDLFRIDAETQYLGFSGYCDSVETNKHYAEYRSDNRINGYVARIEFYRSFGALLIPMLYKNSGFETVKKTLACRSGIYNQYDILYRHPLEAELMREKWYNTLANKTHMRGDFVELLNRHSEICQQPGMTAVNTYSMDF